MFNSLIRMKFSRVIVLIPMLIVLMMGLSVRPAKAIDGQINNLQFHIGCSSFSASADVNNGFGFFVSGPGFTSGNILSGTGHITIASGYGKTLPQGTVVGYEYGDKNFPVNGGTVACSDDGFQGPGIPASFVLQTITCNTPVYTNPGGTPSGANAITAGQTWYVNPVPVKDAKGNSWTEVFVSSYNDPFIPTSCLGGAPAK